MGFSKYANAPIVTPSINLAGWNDVRQKALDLGPSFEARLAAQRVVLQEYDPDRFLLSHCSIIASVDVDGANQPLGRQMVDGSQIDRKYADYLVTPATAKYVNNNNDAWERKLLLACFRTFIGGENYVEHIQIPELSKGKIIDAAARDIGDSIYVDILVATDRKHKPLIEAIASGQLSTLSMGAQVAFTICTKCGNVAEDELQLCRHIKYQKGNSFFDPMGQQRKIAELCGHVTAEPGSVKFIEGSWVANPAFPGAVLRNILDPAMAQMVETRRKIQVAFSQPTRVADPTLLQKAARFAPVDARAKPADHLVSMFAGFPSHGNLHVAPPNSAIVEAELKREARLLEIRSRCSRSVMAQGQDQQFPNPTQDDNFDSKSPAKDDEDPLKKPADDVQKAIVDKVVDQLKEEVSKGDQDDMRDVLNENESNESLIKNALANPEWKKRAQVVLKLAGNNFNHAKTLLAGLILFEKGGWNAISHSRRFTGNQVLAISCLMDRLMKKASMAGESRVYQTVVSTGGTAPYPNVDSYLAACRQVVGRDLTEPEKIQLVFKGKLFSLGR